MKSVRIGFLAVVLAPVLAFGFGYLFLISLVGKGLSQNTLYILIAALVILTIAGVIYSIRHTQRTKTFLPISPPLSKEQRFSQNIYGTLGGIGGAGLLYSSYAIIISGAGGLEGWGIFFLPYILPIASIPVILYILIAVKTQKKYPQFALRYIMMSFILIIGLIIAKVFF